MKWRIYYSDGSTVSSSEAHPFEVAPSGVQAIAFEDEKGNLTVRRSYDYYYWDDAMGWCPCDVGGLWDYLLIRRGPKYVLHGRSVHDDLYWSIVSRAVAEGVGA